MLSATSLLRMSTTGVTVIVGDGTLAIRKDVSPAAKRRGRTEPSSACSILRCENQARALALRRAREVATHRAVVLTTVNIPQPPTYVPVCSLSNTSSSLPSGVSRRTTQGFARPSRYLLRNFATFGAITIWQYGWAALFVW